MTANTLTERGRWIALSVLCLGELMILLDATIVNVALDSIRQDLGFEQSALAWVVNGYLIAFGGLLMLAGRVGDLLGKRRVYLVGLTVFTLASVVCAVSQTQLMLVGARFFQGVGGALTSAVILGMIVTMFPEPDRQAKAIGTYGFITASGGSLGLVLGGALTDGLNWHWIFLINLPIGLLTLLLSLRYVPNQSGIGLGRGADGLGAVLLTAGLMLAVYTILEVGKSGWTSAQTLATGTGAVVLVAAFLVRQARVRNPLVPLGLLRSRAVATANAIQLLMVAAMFAVFFFGALYLQQALGFGPLEVGLSFLPAALTMGITALRLSGPCLMRFGPRTTIIAGLCSILLCLLLFARTPADGSYPLDVLPALILFGLGGGLVFPAMMGLAMSGATDDDAGLTSGLLSTTYQVGGAIGLAALSSIAAARTAGDPSPAAVTAGFSFSYLVAAVLVFGAIVVGIAFVRAPKPAAEPETQAEPDRA
ncbi:DHA2 family efflux MFS transporter permease subunit [Kibdelosporangium philippinense]|uniref:DHA2 family efflux MFS transporter permease subunit n=1 Tax=Kibdelosporangium philippinense TaxID=211113 RepID=A0ABS8Z1Z5_9PSEU|nr:MFS transporter [Kibdelosporangium philippinense]MCE7001956.1 DHA2 family efflux MFS transporter permease subunit [Kibdelosporangium philippinense]